MINKIWEFYCSNKLSFLSLDLLLNNDDENMIDKQSPSRKHQHQHQMYLKWKQKVLIIFQMSIRNSAWLLLLDAISKVGIPKHKITILIRSRWCRIYLYDLNYFLRLIDWNIVCFVCPLSSRDSNIQSKERIFMNWSSSEKSNSDIRQIMYYTKFPTSILNIKLHNFS